MKKRKGFTLIEVIAVLVILSIIVLIVTPIVMNIIRKAKASADKRSIDIYGKTIEIAAVAYMLDDVEFPTDFNELDIEYTGAYVECAVNIVNMDGSVFLDKCAVNGRLIKDSKFASGYYQYGKDKHSYMLTLYKDVNEIINNTSYDNVNHNNVTDSTVDLVTYNGGSYYLLANAKVNLGYEVLVSLSPLSYEDTVNYALGIPVTNINGYGVVPYYTSDTCNQNDTSGCKTDYESSNVKAIIDAWAKDNVANGASASVLTIDYLTSQGYALIGNNIYQKTSTTPANLFELGIDYWAIDDNGNVFKGSSTFNITYPYELGAIRPIIIAKSSDIKKSGNNSPIGADSVTNDTKNPLTVDSIIMYVAMLVIVVCCIILVIYLISKDKKKEENKENNK